MKKRFFIASLCAAVIVFSGCSTNGQTEGSSQITVNEGSKQVEKSEVNSNNQTQTMPDSNAQEEASENVDEQSARERSDIFSASNYTGEPYVIVNDNVPYFNESDYTTEAFETYSDLDSLGRCGVAYANICQELMPTEERESISEVKPTGWHNNPYDFVDGGYVYNRCHLIAFELAGENANEKNLITGTRYFNIEGMLPFENMVADYVYETNNHVLYRVTPEFTGDNLVADGVLMEAYSVEDNGDGIEYCIFCYNVQPGITIDYATGENWADGTEEVNSTSDESSNNSKDAATANDEEGTYILNTNSMKFHKPDCDSVSSMGDNNKQEYTGSRQDLIDQGYSPCGACKP